MSKAYCCDRCGKLYKEQGKTVIITERSLNSYDLCPDCGKEISSWIKNEAYFVEHRECRTQEGSRE